MAIEIKNIIKVEFNRNLILEMMEKWIVLENELSDMGGRQTVATLKTAVLEKHYDLIYELEDEILKHFNLPFTIYYRSIIFLLTNWEYNHLSYKKELVLLRMEKEATKLLQQN
jgi:hypothetical protein